MRQFNGVVDVVRLVSAVVGAGAMLFVAITVYQSQAKANQVLDQSMTAKQVSAPQKEPSGKKLSLEKRLVEASVQTKKNGSKTNNHIVAFGNWMAVCAYTQTSSNSYANCTVMPYNGNAEYKSHLNLTYATRVRVRYQDSRDARVDIVTPTRLRGSDIGLKCSDFVSKGPENKSQYHTFVGSEADRLISRMKLGNCVLSYYDRRSEDVVENKYLSNGFSRANNYAKQYARSPKTVS